MRLYRGQRYLLIIFIVFVLSFFPPSRLLPFMQLQPAKGQVDIARIVVLKTSTVSFPVYEIALRFLDSQGYPVTDIPADLLQLHENGTPLSFTMHPVQGPLQVVFVFDAGAGVRASFKNKPRFQWMQDISTALLERLAEQDSVGVVVVSPQGVDVLQSLTQDKEVAAQHIREWSPSRERNFSAGLEGVRVAISELAQIDSPYPRMIVFFTAGIQVADDMEQAEQEVLRLAQQHDTTVYVVNLHHSGRVIGYQNLVEGSHGAIVPAEQWEELYQAFQPWRSQFVLQARSQTYEATRKLTVAVADRPETAVSWDVTLDIPPQPPLVSLELNEGMEHLIVKVEDQSVTPSIIPVQVNVQWQDPYPRKIQQVALMVNGQPYGTPQTNIEPLQPIVFQWKVQPDNDTAAFAVRVQDELGFVVETEKVLTLEIQRNQVGKQDILCRSLPAIPKIGTPIQSFLCGTLGMGFAELLIAALLGVVATVGFRKREQVKEMAVRVTEVIAQVTKTFGRRKPKARLVLVEGQDESGTVPPTIDLYGETTIGRDPKYADIVFNRPAISRLHCALHEDLNTGGWVVEDKESSNGTFLNGTRLEPLRGYPIKPDDILDIAPLYRGGIRFRFEVLEDAETMENSVLQTMTESLDNIDKTQELDITYSAEMPSSSPGQQPGNTPLAWEDFDLDEDLPEMLNTPANEQGHVPGQGEDDDEFDPSRADF